MLFPDAVLPALDLLDRGLVVRVVLDHALDFGRAVKAERGLPNPAPAQGTASGPGIGARPGAGPGAATTNPAENPKANIKAEAVPSAVPPPHSLKTPPKPATPAADPPVSNPELVPVPNPEAPSFYLVRSANRDRDRGRNRNRSRRGGQTPSGLVAEADPAVGETAAAAAEAAAGGRAYMVRLGAWNCTCAAFVFASFPAGTGPGSRSDSGERDGGEDGMDLDGDEVGVLSLSGFGGMTVDDGGGVPVCKHLMACLLAERWSAALGHNVVERRVGREEMAGITVDS